ncbi:MAG: hypothetical protein M1836_004654 [Candelina mexicana]|nr:MAG: hypothetical protein M1836_004654 [Candelina mexicana]
MALSIPFFNLVVSLLFFTSSTAIPTTPTTCKLCSTYILTNFDEVPGGIPGQGLSAVPTPEDGLKYQSFGIGSPSLLPLVRLDPHSPDQYAISNPQRQITGGGPPTITTTYPNSVIKAFDLKSLFLGCTVDDNSGTTPPTGCTVQFTGFGAADGSTTGPFNANYIPSELVLGTVAARGNMTKVVFPNTFKRLKNVTVNVVGSSLGVANLNLVTEYIDDVSTVLYSCC